MGDVALLLQYGIPKETLDNIVSIFDDFSTLGCKPVELTSSFAEFAHHGQLELAIKYTLAAGPMCIKLAKDTEPDVGSELFTQGFWLNKNSSESTNYVMKMCKFIQKYYSELGKNIIIEKINLTASLLLPPTSKPMDAVVEYLEQTHITLLPYLSESEELYNWASQRGAFLYTGGKPKEFVSEFLAKSHSHITRLYKINKLLAEESFMQASMLAITNSIDNVTEFLTKVENQANSDVKGTIKALQNYSIN